MEHFRGCCLPSRNLSFKTYNGLRDYYEENNVDQVMLVCKNRRGAKFCATPVFCHFAISPFRHLKIGYQLQIYHPRCQIIGHWPFFPVSIGYPLVGDGVANLQQVKNLERDPGTGQCPEGIFLRKMCLGADQLF